MLDKPTTSMDTTAEDVHVRVGVPEDLDAVMELGALATRENAASTPSPEKYLRDVWAALHIDKSILGVIGPVGGPLEGLVLLQLGSLWYSDEQVVEEKNVYVRDEFRSAKGGRARKLVEFSKSVATEMGMKLLIGVLSTERTAGKIRLYERLVGPQAGAFFIFDGRAGAAGETGVKSEAETPAEQTGDV